MILVFVAFQSVILISLGTLHLHWALGGTWGFEKSLPSNEEGERVLNPKKIDSAIVGLGLTLFGLYYLTKVELIPIILPHWASISAGWFISIIFLLRAMGDFKYVGFFKKVRSTPFGKLDSSFFSPLCLMLGVIGILIEVMN